MRKTPRHAWVPDQHGAWGMVIVPLFVGIVLRHNAEGLQWYHAAEAPAWLCAYFFFNATRLWFKAPPQRRPGFVPPVVAYGVATAVFGLAMLMLGGWPVLWWTPWFAALIGWAWWETARRHERAVSSGASTILAASTMTLVARFTTPQAIWHTWADPLVRWDFWIALALFAYFFGTVFHVKTLIRHRGEWRWVALSATYHCIACLGSALLAIFHQASPWWNAFFTACLARTVIMGWLTTQRQVRIKPLAVGLVEIAPTVVITVMSVLV